MDLFPDLPGFDIEKTRASQFATSVQTSASGKELRATFMTGVPRFEFTIKLNVARRASWADAPQDEIRALLRCYGNARGKLNPLMMIDPIVDFGTHYLADSDGSTLTYQIVDDEGYPAGNIQQYGGLLVENCLAVPAGAAAWACDPSPAAPINASYPIWADGELAPVVIPVSAGTQFTIAASGAIEYIDFNDAPGSIERVRVGPDGGPRPTGSWHHDTFSQYCGHTSEAADIGGLIGAFTDSAGTVISVVWIGASASLTTPAGATQLQLGINGCGSSFSKSYGYFFVSTSLSSQPKNTALITTTSLSDGPFDFSTTTGLYQFGAGCLPPAGARMSWIGAIGRKVRFADDSLSLKQIAHALWAGDSIKLVSLK